MNFSPPNEFVVLYWVCSGVLEVEGGGGGVSSADDVRDFFAFDLFAVVFVPEEEEVVAVTLVDNVPMLILLLAFATTWLVSTN